MSTKILNKTLLAAAVAASLAACTTVGPDYHLPKEAVINRQGANAPFVASSEPVFKKAPLPAQWWRLYDDPTLDKLIEKALVANTDLRIAAANLARARGVLDEAKMAGVPTVGANATATYGRASAAAKGLADPLPDGWSHDGGVTASYQIDLFGKIARGIEAADAETEAAQAALDLARVTVAADTAKAYVDACSSSRQIIVANQSVGLQEQSVDTTERLVRAGRGTQLDISRARSQLGQLKAAVPPLQAQHRTALFRLAVLTGELPSAVPKDVEQCSTIPKTASAIPVGDGASLLRRRPDIRQAERSLAAATARIGVATADLYPSISLGLSGGSTGPMSTLGDANALRWGIGPLISWTLPVTGTARSRIAQAEAGSDAALARFDATVLNALRETESALTAYARELDRNGALKAARDHSALASQQADKLYRYGRTDFLTTLDANRTLASTESTLAASDAQLAKNQVSVFLALGGGWEKKSLVPPAAKPTAPQQPASQKGS